MQKKADETKIRRQVNAIMSGHESVVSEVLKGKRAVSSSKQLIASLGMGKGDVFDVEYKLWKGSSKENLHLVKSVLSNETQEKDFHKEMTNIEALKEIVFKVSSILTKDKEQQKSLLQNLKEIL
jgi:ribosome biogenesis protein Nip4